MKPCPLDLQKNLTVPSCTSSSSIRPFIEIVRVLRVIITSGSLKPSGNPPWGDNDRFRGDVILI